LVWATSANPPAAAGKGQEPLVFFRVLVWVAEKPEAVFRLATDSGEPDERQR